MSVAPKQLGLWGLPTVSWRAGLFHTTPGTATATVVVPSLGHLPSSKELHTLGLSEHWLMNLDQSMHSLHPMHFVKYGALLHACLHRVFKDGLTLLVELLQSRIKKT